jgi:hypothetical protein
MKRKQNCIDRYMNEETDIMAEDGHIMTREEVIKELHSQGWQWSSIDRFLFQVDRRMMQEAA